MKSLNVIFTKGTNLKKMLSLSKISRILAIVNKLLIVFSKQEAIWTPR